MALCAKIGVVVAVVTILIVAQARGDERIYRCEFGIEGGCGYYVGDAAPYMFRNVREMYGANFRYHFDQRWSLAVQGITHRITGAYENDLTGRSEKWTNHLVNMDVAAEFNFFRFGGKCYDRRVKRLSPYLMLGVGVCLHNDMRQIAAYIPFGIGLKWKMAPHTNLQLLWQNNLYFADNLETVDALNNPHGLNGTNIFNNDLTGTIALGLTFEFAKDKKVCRICKW